jgi:hypothetical protein
VYATHPSPSQRQCIDGALFDSERGAVKANYHFTPIPVVFPSQSTLGNQVMNQPLKPKQPGNPKLVPHIPLPFDELMADVLKIKPPAKPTESEKSNKLKSSSKARKGSA